MSLDSFSRKCQPGHTIEQQPANKTPIPISLVDMDMLSCGLVSPERIMTSAVAELTPARVTHLKALEAESIHILREVAAEFSKPVMLYSIGKDSSVMLRLAQKAFYPGADSLSPAAHRYDGTSSGR